MAGAQTALLIALGGAIGTVLRWLTGVALAREGVAERLPDFPWGTLAVNVIGSFALGVVATTLEDKRILGTDARLVLGTGVMGGFTTYSTFNLETLRMLERGDLARAALYVAVTLLVCLAAGAGGIALGRAIRGG